MQDNDEHPAEPVLFRSQRWLFRRYAVSPEQDVVQRTERFVVKQGPFKFRKYREERIGLGGAAPLPETCFLLVEF